MDNLADHMKWLKQIEAEEAQRVEDDLVAEYADRIKETYTSLWHDVEGVLEKHMPECFKIDLDIDAEVAAQKGKDPSPEQLVFLLVTANIIATHLTVCVEDWLVRKGQALKPGGKA